MRARPLDDLHCASGNCPFGLGDTAEQRTQIDLGAVPRLFTMGNIDTPAGNFAVHAKEVARPSLVCRTVVDEDLRADDMDESVFDHNLGWGQRGTKG
jgi:hypothetical protein